MRKYVIVQFIESQPEDQTKFSIWPLHLTIVPPFEIEWDAQEVLSKIGSVVMTHPAHTITAQSEEMFGTEANIPVMTFGLTQELAVLNSRLVDFLEQNNATFTYPRFIRDYRPHTSAQGDQQLHPGDTVSISRLSIVDREPDGNPTERRVVGAIELS